MACIGVILERVAYRPSMRVTHLEFLHTRDRVRRMSLYTKTNSRIETFKELSAAQRVSVVWRLLSNWQAYQ